MVRVFVEISKCVNGIHSSFAVDGSHLDGRVIVVPVPGLRGFAHADDGNAAAVGDGGPESLRRNPVRDRCLQWQLRQLPFRSGRRARHADYRWKSKHQGSMISRAPTNAVATITSWTMSGH
ncbi:hypothetical protein ACFTWF_33205 [Rhodococcus sp. NPDC056960]|uniref:hypothetical protein n=1 Tax=Rhodococcus sp. NPDC056960 TaxID=3345982 RepID=UPI0036262489